MAAASYFVLLFFFFFAGGAIRRREDGDAEVQRLRQRQGRQTGVSSWIFFFCCKALLARVVVERRARIFFSSFFGRQSNNRQRTKRIKKNAAHYEAVGFVASRKGSRRRKGALCWRNASQNLRACEERGRKKLAEKEENYLIGPSTNGRREWRAGNGEWRGDLEGWRGTRPGPDGG